MNLIFSSVIVISELLQRFHSIITKGKERFFIVKTARLTNFEGGHFSGKYENLSLAGNYGVEC